MADHIARCFSRVSDYQSVSQSLFQIVEKSSDGGKNWAPLRYFRLGIRILLVSSKLLSRPRNNFYDIQVKSLPKVAIVRRMIGTTRFIMMTTSGNSPVASKSKILDHSKTHRVSTDIPG